MKKNRVWYFLRIFVSIGVIVSLFWLIDIDKIPKIENIKVSLVVVVFILALFDRLVNAYKWSFLVRAAGLKISFKQLLKIYFTSGFIGLALPSGVGGELLKGYGLAKTTSKAIDSASSVIVGRVTGLLGLTILCVAGYFAAGAELRSTSVIFMVKNISLLILVITISTVIIGFSLPKSYVVAKKGDGKVLGFVRKVMRSFYQYRKEKNGLALAMLLSVFIHVIRAVGVCVAGLSVGISLEFFYYLIFVPFIQLGGMVPITMGGMGVKEGVAVYLFSLVGVEGASALSMYIIVRVMAIASVGPGGWIYFKSGLTVEGPSHTSRDTVKSDAR